MTEIWKDIKGYEGLYQVSSRGNVRSVDRNVEVEKGGIRYFRKMEGKPIKPFPSTGGYLILALSIHSRHRTFHVHRLVAEAFLPNPGNLPQVNHKNEVRTDNRAENLEWCSNHYNMHYGNCQQRIKQGQRTKAVEQYSAQGKLLRRFDSIAEASRATGATRSAIRYAASGKYKTSLGFVWKYAE